MVPLLIDSCDDPTFAPVTTQLVDGNEVVAVDFAVAVAILQNDQITMSSETGPDFYLLEFIHVSLHCQGRTVGVTGTISVGRGGFGRFVVDGGLPSIGPVSPGYSKRATNVTRAAVAGVAGRNGFAYATQTLLVYRQVLLGRCSYKNTLCQKCSFPQHALFELFLKKQKLWIFFYDLKYSPVKQRAATVNNTLSTLAIMTEHTIFTRLLSVLH